MKDDIMMGVTLLIDKDNMRIYATFEEKGNFFEGQIKKIALDKDPKSLAGTKYDALFTGTIEINLEDYPCSISSINETKLQAMAQSIGRDQNPNQEELFNQNKQEEESSMATEDSKKGKVKQVAPPDPNSGYKWFDPEQYEKARANGIKLLPPGLSRKNRGKWNNERRQYEESKGYETMYVSEKGKSEEEIKEEIVKESKEILDKGLEAYIADKNGLEKTDVILVNPDKDKPNHSTPDWNLGEGNYVGTFGEFWDKGFFIGKKGDSDIFATATTNPHPINGFKYTLCFLKLASAQWTMNQLEAHGNLSQQIDGARLLKINESLTENMKTIPCVWIDNAYNYLNSKAIK